jgi:pyruvate/2-oxoglutarate dehydrogenase complex dihydrolipoamide dehydrogenase (E3) component
MSEASATEYDLCIVGGGSAGYAGAVTARELGRSVVIVDGPGPLAGLCILRGCMPSKTLLRSAEVAQLVRQASEYGVIAAPPRIDAKAVVDRKRRIIKDFADYRIDGLETFAVIREAARFTGPDSLEAGGKTITAEKFLIATGSSISVPHIRGLTETGFVTSDDVLELESLPKSVVVLGGGPTACELAQYLSRLGVATTMVQRSATLLSDEDEDVARSLRGALERDGITVITGTTLTGVERSGGSKTVRFARDGEEMAVMAEEIFIALGRDPNIAGLDLEAAGIAHGEGIKVDEFLRTSNPRVYAAGDVLHESLQLVHVAVHEGMLAVCNAFGPRQKKVDYSLQSARAVFTEPQVAVAGLTERECVARGIEHAIASYPFDDLGKGIATGRTEGFVKMIAAPDGKILGVAIVGAEASDLIHEAIALLYFGANVRDVMEMPHLHPTLSEIMTYPAESLMERLDHEKRPLVTP